MTKLVNPTPLFLDGRGLLLDAGSVWIGEMNTDPEVPANQVDLFWDKAMTIPAEQPLRTLGGVIVNGQNPAFVYFAEVGYSITIRDADDNLVSFIPSATDTGGIAYQPLHATLTALAAVATTPYGRALLALANVAALQAAVGIGPAGFLDIATIAQYRSNVANKVLTTDKAWGAAGYVPLVAAAGTVAVDLNAGFNFTLAMTGGPWTLDFSNLKAGEGGTIEISQDAAGNRVLNFAAEVVFAGGVDPVLSVAANAKDILSYKVLSDGATVFASLAKGVG